MLVLNAAEMQNLITMQDTIKSVSVALTEFSSKRTLCPVRTAITVQKGNGTSLVMPAFVQARDSLGVKFVSVFPDNKQAGLQTINGVMLLANADTGAPTVLMDAGYLTVLRTGAAAALATQRLARKNASVLGIIGTGAQATGVVNAIMAIRRIQKILLYNRTTATAHRFAAEIEKQLRYMKVEGKVQIDVLSDPDSTVSGSDIVVTATSSDTPVFSAEAVRAGAHINAIGSFRPSMQEIPSELIARADKVVVESIDAALEETGDLLIPIQQGLIQPHQIYAELGEIAAGHKPGRERQDEVTVFKSVGLAVMDAVVAKLLYDRAVEAGVGQQVSI